MTSKHGRFHVATAILAIGLFSVPLVANSQTSAQVHRIAILGSGTGPLWNAFRQQMSDLGYVDQRNISYEVRSVNGKSDQFSALALELVATKPDVIVTAGVQGTRAAMQATSTIPIVMAVSAYPEKVGLVASLAKPGGNVTGLTSFAGVLQGKQLELLKEIVPNASRVALLFDPTNSVEPIGLEQLRAAAPAVGVEIVPIEMRSPDDSEKAFAAITSGGVHALVVHANPINFSQAKLITQFGLSKRMPSIYGSGYFVENGGLMSYAPSLPDLFRRAATYVDKIIKGAKPADLPVEQPSKFELVINSTTATSFGLTIPPSVMLRADRVID